MNKLKLTFTGLLIACLGFGVANAQDKTATTTPTPAKKAPAKKATATKSTNGSKAAAKPAGSHMKKDGTPDKRYKENKTAKPAGDKTAAKPAAKKTGTKKSTKSTTGGAAKSAKPSTPKKASAPADNKGM